MKHVLLALLAAGTLAPGALADGEIQIRLSFKSILYGFGIPAGPDESSLDQAIDRLNQDMLRNNAAYRFVRVDPLIQVGDPDHNERPDPSHYSQFNGHFDDRADMQSDALANQALWAWNPTAINVYFNLDGGTYCPYPCGQLILVQDLRSVDNEYYLHEIGDYFNLCKTQGCPCEFCDAFAQGPCFTVPADDGITDTLPDLPTWDRDDIAQFTFALNFGQLSTPNQELVLDVYHNALSDRVAPGCQGDVTTTNRLTGEQLDRWNDAASTTRAAVCDGRIFYVMSGAGGSQNGRSTNPFDRVAEGLTAANGGGDVVMVRSGVYPENLTISAPVTLRAPRGHVARIGTP